MFRQDTARRGRYHLLMPHLERHQAMPWDQGAGTAKAVISCMVSPTTPWNNAGLLFNSFWQKRKAATYNHRCLRLKVWNPVNISFFTTETAITKTTGLSIIYKYTLISFYILLAHEKNPTFVVPFCHVHFCELSLLARLRCSWDCTGREEGRRCLWSFPPCRTCQWH